jgi:ACS family D-galactonate transporter-like MFS transporter
MQNRWGMALLASSGILVTYILRLNISSAAPTMQKSLNLSDFELGLVLSSFLWSYTFLQPIAGLVTDRFGARLSLLYGVLATSLVTIATGATNSFSSLFALRFVLGATQAPNFVSGAKLSSSDWFKADQRGRATSIWIAGGRLGPVVAFPLAAWLAISYGWQWAFYGTGMIALVWCISWYVGFRDSPDVQEQKTTHRRSRGSIKIVLSPLGLGFAIASFGQGYVAYYLNLWLPIYLVKQQKFTVIGAGLLSTLPLICAVVTLLLIGGFLSDYLVKKSFSSLTLRRNLFCVGMIAASVMMFATAYAPDPYSALVSLSLAGAALGFSTPSLWVALVEATPRDLAGTMGGLQNLGGNFAGIVVSILTGYIVQVSGSFFMALVAGSGAALLGAVAAFTLIRRH